MQSKKKDKKQFGEGRKKNNKIPLPKKTWQKNESVKKITNVQQLLGGRGQNIDVPSNNLESLRTSLVVPTMARVLPIDATVPYKAIYNMSLGIVLHAIKHGLSSLVTGAETNPYYMYRYLSEVFITAMKGTIPKLQQAPVWFWEMCYAIKSKQASFKVADVNYTWVFTNPISDEVPIPMGLNPEAYEVYLTQSNAMSVILGFPALAPSVPYTTDLGADSIKNLWASCVGTAVMTQLVGDPGDEAYCNKDTSSFSVVYPELGGSFQTSGALKNTVYSERQIDSPLLAKLAAYQPIGTEDWRGWQKASANGGSSCLIGPTLMGLSSKTEIRTKVSPIIKFYNFDEFYEVLSLTVATACGSKFHNQGTLITQCPLSPIQVQILLRQTMIPLFSNEKCQDIRMTDANSESLLPFTVGQNGVSEGTNMLLPTFLAENIRAAKSFSNRIMKDNPRTLMQVLSVLSRPSQKPQLGNYTVEGQAFSVVYTVDGNDQLIRLIDCSAVQGNQVFYLDLTRSEIKLLESRWNNWIQTLSTNLTPLVAIGITDGISLLKTGTLTNFQGQGAPPPVPQVQPVAASLTKKHSTNAIVNIPGLSRSVSTVSAPLPGTAYFESVTDRYTTSLQILSGPVWKFLSLWILPVALANPAAIEEQSIQGWSAFFCEVYRVPRSTAGGLGSVDPVMANRNPSAYDRHVSMSQIDVKGIAQDGQVELISDLLEMAKQGRGSFFDALASLVGPAIKAISSF